MPNAFCGLRSALFAVLATGTGPLAAQNVVTPSAHFGTLMYPELEPMGQWGLHFDRFTEFDGDTLPDGHYRFLPYNDLHQTIGLNLLAVAITGKLKRWPTLVYRIVGSIGYSGNQPTGFFQNKVIHKLRGFREVPVRATRHRFPKGGVSIDVNRWIDSGAWNLPFFVGAGGSLSTINSEVFAQAGFRAPRWGPSAMIRVGAS